MARRLAGGYADGSELFFRALDGTLMAARVDKVRAKPLVPEPRFKTDVFLASYNAYAVSKNGRFLDARASRLRRT